MAGFLKVDLATPTRRVILLLMALSLASCNYSGGDAVAGVPVGSPPTAWIDRPLDGSVVALGVSVPIRWHATDPSGISEVEVQINGVTLQVVGDLDPQAQLVTEEAIWGPAEPGEYLIEVIATNLNGVVGPPAAKRLTVIEAPMPSPTASLTLTPLPTITPTTNLPAPPATVPVLPIATTIVPTDDVPPPKPQIISPDGELVGCLEDIVLRWNAVTDSSGIDYYEVVLKVNTGGSNFSTVGTWQVESFTALDVSQQTDCGSTYGWTVRARDNAGNWGPLDAALFGIDLP